MKKFLSLLLVLSLVFLTACANTETSDTTIDPNADTTQTTETTTASEQTTETSESTRPLPVYETEIRETAPLHTEIPELQEKIDSNQKKFPYIANKIVIEIGEQRDVPPFYHGNASYVFTGSFIGETLAGGFDGLSHAPKSFFDNEKIDFPVFRVREGDTIRIYINDVKEEKHMFTVLDYTENENSPDHIRYQDFETLCAELGSGTHYVYTDLKCEGNHVYKDGVYQLTESVWFRAYFILEIE